MKFVPLLFLITLCFFCSISSADTETENQALTRLVHEMDALNIIIKEAKHQQDPHDKQTFQYMQLQADLKKVRAGILAHINRTKELPKRITPIQGDYQ